MYNLSTATLERSEHGGLGTPLSAIPLLPTDQIDRGKKISFAVLHFHMYLSRETSGKDLICEGQ